MKLGKITQWSPFVYSYIGYEGQRLQITFTCSKCGGHNCEKINSVDTDNFWSGHFRCSDCGNRRDADGNCINYYSRSFKHLDGSDTFRYRPVDDDEIADLCLRCQHRQTIYKLLNMPFCDFSSTTCSKKHNKLACPDYERKKPRELSLFE